MLYTTSDIEDIQRGERQLADDELPHWNNLINLTPHIRCTATHAHASHFYQADCEGSNRTAARFYCVETDASREQRRKNSEGFDTRN